MTKRLKESQSNKNTMPIKKRHRTVPILLFLLAVTVGCIFALYTWRIAFFEKKVPAPQEQKVPVRTVEAVIGDFPVYISSLGTVNAGYTVVVRSRVNGLLQKILFTEGQMVAAGDVLGEIDPRPFQAQLDQALGQLERDKALLVNAKQNLNRAEVLLKQKSTTPQDLDADKALVMQYEGTYKLNKALVEAAKLNLEFTKITAPVSGKVGLLAVDAGNMITTADPFGIVTITQMQPINVQFTVTDVQLALVQARLDAGSSLQVEAWDRTQQMLLDTGVLLTLDNQIDISTGTIKAKAQFSNKNYQLFPNQFVNIKLLVSTLEQVCIVPTPTVQIGSQGTFIYVVGADSRVQMRPVSLGPGNDTYTVINQGVKAGEQLVLDGLDRLRDKTLVSIIPVQQDPAKTKQTKDSQ